MKISELSKNQLSRLLREGKLLLHIPPFVACVRSDVPTLAGDIAFLYADFSLSADGTFADFHVAVMRDKGLRRWFKPQSRFSFDGQPTFTGLPTAQAMAMLEWGLNWCVAAFSHQYLVIHAALIEKAGCAVLMPAPPGSGKSTLCAGLVIKGWRLLSDELALYDLTTGLIYGMARPVNLKNHSIDIAKRLSPDTQFTAPMPNTTKGTIALMRPPSTSVARSSDPVRASWVILPKYRKDAPASLVPQGCAQTLMLIAEQSFNYDILGKAGFDAAGQLVGAAQCRQFTYSSLDDAEAVFESLLTWEPAP